MTHRTIKTLKQHYYSLIGNADNDLYAFYMGKSDLVKNEANMGGGPPPVPLFEFDTDWLMQASTDWQSFFNVPQRPELEYFSFQKMTLFTQKDVVETLFTDYFIDELGTCLCIVFLQFESFFSAFQCWV